MRKIIKVKRKKKKERKKERKKGRKRERINMNQYPSTLGNIKEKRKIQA